MLKITSSRLIGLLTSKNSIGMMLIEKKTMYVKKILDLFSFIVCCGKETHLL